MAFARVATFPGGTAEQYRAVVEELGDAHVNAPGRLLLAAGSCDDGWQIVQVWASREAFAAFVEQHARPALARAGARGFRNRPTLVEFDVYDLVSR